MSDTKTEAREVPTYQVTVSHDAVWLNDTFKCVARFGSKGYEIEEDDTATPPRARLAVGIDTPTTADWVTFVKLVWNAFDVDLSPSYARPGFIADLEDAAPRPVAQTAPAPEAVPAADAA